MSNSYYGLARQAAMGQVDFLTLAVYLVSHLGLLVFNMTSSYDITKLMFCDIV